MFNITTFSHGLQAWSNDEFDTGDEPTPNPYPFDSQAYKDWFDGYYYEFDQELETLEKTALENLEDL